MIERAYAIIRSGGKQYRVSEGDKLWLEKITASPGDNIELKDVLFYKADGTVLIGRPILKNVSVTCEVRRQTRGRKVIVFKKKRRKNYKKTMGHRQDYTEVLIKEIRIM